MMPVKEYYKGSGKKVMKEMQERYGEEEGKRVFYATANKREMNPEDTKGKKKKEKTQKTAAMRGFLDGYMSKAAMAAPVGQEGPLKTLEEKFPVEAQLRTKRLNKELNADPVVGDSKYTAKEKQTIHQATTNQFSRMDQLRNLARAFGGAEMGPALNAMAPALKYYEDLRNKGTSPNQSLQNTEKVFGNRTYQPPPDPVEGEEQEVPIMEVLKMLFNSGFLTTGAPKTKTGTV